MWWGIFPKILAHFEGTGTLTVTVTDTESRGEQRQAAADRRVSGGADAEPQRIRFRTDAGKTLVF